MIEINEGHPHLHVCLCELDERRRRAMWRIFAKSAIGFVKHFGTESDLSFMSASGVARELTQELQDAAVYLPLILGFLEDVGIGSRVEALQRQVSELQESNTALVEETRNLRRFGARASI